MRYERSISQGPPVSKLILVQILRALAALSVAFHHALHDGAALAEARGLTFAPPHHIPWAAGVDVFFVISGFIMVHASRGLFGEPGAARVFLARRVARIVPLYWGVTTLYLALALAAPSLLNSAILEPWPVAASYLFIPFERPDGVVQPLYSLGWTLNYEMFFYALFALVIALPQRRALILLILALVALSTLGRWVALPLPFAFWADTIILEFAFGVVIGRAHADGVRLGRIERAALAAFGIALLALDLTRGDVAGPRAFAWGFPAAALVAAAVLGRDGAAARGLLTRFAVAVGDASYALYLLHPFAIRGGRVLFARTGLADGLGPWAFVAFALVAATGLALAVHWWLERPATEWLRRRLEPSLAGQGGIRRGDAAQRQHP